MILCRCFKGSRLKTFALVAVLSIACLGAAYVAGNRYVQHKLTQRVDAVISRLHSTYPNVQISYQKVEMSLVDALFHRFEIEDLTITPETPWLLASIEKLKVNLTLDDQNIPTAFTVKLEGVEFPASYKYFEFLTGPAKPSTKAALKAFSANSEISYSRAQGTLSLHSSLLHHQTVWGRHEDLVRQFLITTPIDQFQKIDLENLLNHSIVEKMQGNTNVEFELSSSSLEKSAPDVAELLKKLHYSTLKFQLNGQGHYDGTTQTNESEVSVNLPEAGKVHLVTQTQLPAPLSLNGLFQRFYSNDLSTFEKTKIISFLCEYQDQGLLDRFLDSYAHTVGRSKENVKTLISGFLTTSEFQEIPLLQQATAQLLIFLNNPKTITLKVKPAQALSLEDLSVEADKNQEEHWKLATQVDAIVDPVEKQKALEAASTRYSELSNQYLNKIGFSIQAVQ